MLLMVDWLLLVDCWGWSSVVLLVDWLLLGVRRAVPLDENHIHCSFPSSSFLID
jgi:hypothetical protein